MTFRTLQKGTTDDNKNCLPVNKGGTGSSKIVTAAKNLKLVTNAMKNIPNGVIGISNNGLIDPAVLPPGLSFNSSINVTGPLSLVINQVRAYTITDYDINTAYSISAISGSVSRSGNTITYTAPGVTGSGGFILNGKSFTIAIGSVLPSTPSITSPSTGSTGLLSSISFIANTFSMIAGSDTHEGSDWQIATDAGFTSIVSQVTNSSTNKTSWSVSGLLSNTTYYVRVRYKGVVYGYSSWSSTINFTTKSVFTPTVEEAAIVGSPRTNFDQFGHSVDTNDTGTIVVVGSPNSPTAANPNENSGSVFIYNKSGGSYVQEIKIDRSTITGIQFGWSVAISKDGLRIAIGYMGGNPSGLGNAGVVYIYSKASGTWAKEATLSASDIASGDYFGSCVDIDSNGSRVVIGAKLASQGANNDNGKVYIFTRSGTTWTQERILTPSTTINGNAQFGISVAIDNSGTRVIVGAPFENKTSVPTATTRGYAYIFLRTGTSWAQEAKLSEGGINNSGENYGYSVDIDSTGSRVVISIPHYNNSVVGGAVVLLRTGTSWALESTLLSGEATQQFGGQPESVSISSDGSVIAIGDYSIDISGTTDNGAVYIFTRSGTTWSKLNRLTTTLQANEYFGFSTCLSADGSKVIIGARGRTISSIQSGAVYSFV